MFKFIENYIDKKVEEKTERRLQEMVDQKFASKKLHEKISHEIQNHLGDLIEFIVGGEVKSTRSPQWIFSSLDGHRDVHDKMRIRIQSHVRVALKDELDSLKNRRMSIDQRARGIIQGEDFIDKIIERIKRKQLPDK